MKFLLYVCLVAILGQSIYAQSSDSKLRTRCTYFADRLILNCTGPSGVRVECEAANEFPMKIKIVGISIPSDIKEQDPKMRRFNLHPLREDNAAWLNSRVMLNGATTSFSLYQTNFIRDAGFRLRDAQCLERLSELLRSSTPNLIVPSTSEVQGDIKADKSKSKIELVGEIFWFERSPMARSQKSQQTRVKKEVMMMGSVTQNSNVVASPVMTSPVVVEQPMMNRPMMSAQPMMMMGRSRRNDKESNEKETHEKESNEKESSSSSH
jgi:hypothetical protein